MKKSNVRPFSDLQNNYDEVVKLLDSHDHVVLTDNDIVSHTSTLNSRVIDLD